MKSNKKTAFFMIGFVIAGLLVSVIFPAEQKGNPKAQIRIGAGDDISGILMEETVASLGEDYTVHETVESTSFQDC